MRQVIRIDERKCDGCGQCVTACAEGAIQIIDGKARLVSEVYCDGLGACLGHCPQGAITVETREAAPFDEQAVAAHLASLASGTAPSSAGPSVSAGAGPHAGHACPGSATQTIRPRGLAVVGPVVAAAAASPDDGSSALSNWPVQLHLVSPAAPSLAGADILLAADCVPFAMGDFHARFLRGRPVIIGCPKLDDTDAYLRKVRDIFATARPASLTVLHMEVPCCSGLVRLAQIAHRAAGSSAALRDVTVGIRGQVLRDEDLASPAR